MGEQYKCDICGVSLNESDRIDYTKSGMIIHACANCSYQIEGLKYKETKDSSVRFLQEKQLQGGSSLFGKSFIQDLLSQNENSNQPAPKVKNSTQSKEKPYSKYKDPVSTIMIGVVALFCLIGGIIMLIAGAFSISGDNNLFIYTGIGTIITSALLFVIMNMAIDIHHMNYNIAMIADENNLYQREIILPVQIIVSPYFPDIHY